MSIQEEEILAWCRGVSHKNCENRFVRELRRNGFDTKQVHVVISALESVCNECFDESPTCQCWNDE